jgi:multiple sugar transport system ATP-binding protein
VKLSFVPGVGAKLDAISHERLVAGFRPESLRVGDGPIRAQVRAVEDLGSEVFVHIGVEHEGATIQLVAKMPAPFAGKMGDSVGLEINGTMHLFEPDGARLLTAMATTGTA